MSAVISPIVPVMRPAPFDDPEWAFELKYDGFRAMAHVDLALGACTFYSKTGKEMKQFRELGRNLVQALRESRGNSGKFILDGEIVSPDPDSGGGHIFLNLLRKKGGRIYVVFDLLFEDGDALARDPLSRRRSRLKRLVPENSPVCQIAHQERKTGIALFEAVKRLNLEGVIAKRLADPYGPETTWFKILNPGYAQKAGRHALFRKNKR